MQLIEERQLATARDTRIGTSLKVSSISRDCTQWGKGQQQQFSPYAHQVNLGGKPNTGE